MANKNIKINSVDNRKIIYYLKKLGSEKIITINSVDEIEDRVYEANVELNGTCLKEYINKGLSLNDGLKALIYMADAICLMHDEDEPIAVDNLSLDDFYIDNDRVYFASLDKLMWAEPEYVVKNIESFRNIINEVLPYIDFENQKNATHLKDIPMHNYRTMDLLKLELQRAYHSSFKKYNPKLPVGFRTGEVKRNAIAIIIYFIMLNIAIRSDFSSYTSLDNRICEFIYFVIMVICFFFVGNYLDAHKLIGLDKIKNKWFRYLLIILITIVIFYLLFNLFIKIIALI